MKQIVRYDGNSGEILSVRPFREDVELHETEIITEKPRSYFNGKIVDVEDGEFIEDPKYDARGPVDQLSDRFESVEGDDPVCRGRISAETREEFEVARKDNDLETQVAILYEVLTGQDFE